MKSGPLFRVFAILAGPAVVLLSQQQFEAASIKLNRSGNRASGEHTSHGTLTVTNDTLKELVEFAFDVKDFQLTGGPRWFDTDHYDIVAKISRDIGDSELKSLTRSLLADRFRLRVHREKREVTAYSLVIARKGARPGPKLSEHSGAGEFSSNTTSHSLQATNATTGALAASLSRILGRPVADNTGLKGAYDYKVEWPADEPADSSTSGIFSALQDQLGLKLDATKSPVQILVIDGAERPSEN